MVKHPIRWLPALYLLPVLASASETVSAIDIKQLMTKQEQTLTGISKLSNAEITALNHWLVRFTGQEAPLLLESNESVKAVQNSDISASVLGDFNGWTGDTLFRLDNGQIWKQRTPGKWRTHKEAVKVHISQNALGFWEMRVDGAQRSIGVKRIK
jgi:hypothetical protein